MRSGRRTPLREFLVFDAALRSQLLHTEPRDWPALTRKAVAEQGQSYARAIELALAAGRITEQVAQHEMRNIG